MFYMINVELCDQNFVISLYMCVRRYVSPVFKGRVCTSVLQQEADDLSVTLGGCHMQSCPSIIVDSFDIHSRKEVPEKGNHRIFS